MARAALRFPGFRRSEVADKITLMDLVENAIKRELLGRRVLLVDDEPNVQFAIKYLIREWNFEVLTASSATEALELFEHVQKVDLVITDYSMPDMNGLELARRVRRMKPDQRILMLTALPELLQGDGRASLSSEPGEEMPVNRILPKPPSPISKLRKAMEELLCVPALKHA